jgi:hypothetical protein
MIEVNYPFKEYGRDVDEFVIETFNLFGVVSLGFGTDFISRDLGGVSDSEIKCLKLMDYLHSCPFISFRVSYYLTKKTA